MSLKLVFMLLALAGIFGTAFGYFLRWITSLGRRGSLELEVRQKLLEAGEEAKNITKEADRQAKKEEEVRLRNQKEHEGKIEKTEARLIKKEELLDKRQLDMENQVEKVKEKIEEIKEIREKAEELEQNKRVELENVAKLSSKDAKEELFKTIERQSEEDLLVRMQKMEDSGAEKLEIKAREILTSAIHRLGNSVS
ncbi:DUF3552 domain-containing protein, partial [Patescibacteria group bacterium]|nr:DUF3552 domain-containing protein [Patescibacteria group bacterium]